MSEGEGARPFDLAPGEVVGSYRVEHVIGGGGVGTVYAAEDTTTGRRVALKVLRMAHADDPQASARFEREARAIAHIGHPSIVDVLAFGHVADGRPYVVMQLLEGRTLREEIDASGKLTPGACWRLLRPIADALAAAHDEGLVHRDVKPDNIFVERPRRGQGEAPAARLLDFGLVRALSSSDLAGASLTGTGTPIGTPAYMAPEQWWGQEVGPAVDQYALGLVLFEALTGERPFVSERFAELMQLHLHAQPPSLSSRGVAAPQALEALIARMLSKEPAARFSSMHEAMAEADRAFSGGPPSAQPLASVQADARSEAAPVEGPSWALSIALPVASVAATLAAGYAGPERWSPRGMFLNSGYSAWPIALCALGAPLFLPRKASQALSADRPLLSPFVLVLLPLSWGVLGTFTGFGAVSAALAKLGPVEQISVLHQGVYEANTNHFMGLGFSLSLSLLLLALLTPRLPRAAGLALPLSCLAVAAGAVALSSASPALVASSLALVLFTLRDEPPARLDMRELMRELTALVAFALAAALAETRLEGREAIAWVGSLSRAERAAEIGLAAFERQGTNAVAVLGLVLLGVVLARRMAPLLTRERIASLGPRAVAVPLALVVTFAVDASLFTRYLGRRDDLRREVAPQFALFRRLDPPAAEGLDHARYAPKQAPSLQIAADAVAVDGQGVVRLSAIDGEGAPVLKAALGRALTGGDRGAGPDLSVLVDRSVDCGVVKRLLSMAHDLGARQVQILFTRGAQPVLSPSAPPEASWVLPSDFVAVPAALSIGEGLALDDGVAFSAVKGWGPGVSLRVR